VGTIRVSGLASFELIYLATSKGNTKPPTPSNAPAKSAPAHSEGGTRRPSPSTTQEPTAPTPIDSLPPPDSDSASESESDDSEESSGGAFNPTTGEINWDCPCLGGMAHGPCGLQFREAFSCFVFSEQEPKGIDCVEKFKAMQDCFREHPDVYAEGDLLLSLLLCSLCSRPPLDCLIVELMDDEEEEAAGDANTPGDEVPPTQDGDPHPAGALSSTTSPATTTPSSSPEISSSVNTKTRPKKVD
jgi:hypothetical protein